MGIVAETYDRNRPQCCGRIRSHMRHLRTQLASWPWPQVFRLAPEGRFAVRQTMTWMTGFIAGYRSSRRNEYVLP